MKEQLYSKEQDFAKRNSSHFFLTLTSFLVFFYQVPKRQCMNMMKNLRCILFLDKSTAWHICVFLQQSLLGVKICLSHALRLVSFRGHKKLEPRPDGLL